MHHLFCGGAEASFNWEDAMSHYVGLLLNRLRAVQRSLAFPVRNHKLWAPGHRQRQGETHRWQLLPIYRTSQAGERGEQVVISSFGPATFIYQAVLGLLNPTEQLNRAVTRAALWYLSDPRPRLSNGWQTDKYKLSCYIVCLVSFTRLCPLTLQFGMRWQTTSNHKMIVEACGWNTKEIFKVSWTSPSQIFISCQRTSFNWKLSGQPAPTLLKLNISKSTLFSRVSLIIKSATGGQNKTRMWNKERSLK